jgi:thiol-disulfide isomerase/thioredoxin
MNRFAPHRSIQGRATAAGALGAILAAALLLLAGPATAAGNGGPQALWASTLPDAAGQQQSLAQYKGHPLVVNFWASWCGPCVAEMPELSALQGQYSQKGIQFVGIGVDSAENIQGFLHKVKVSYPIYVAGFGGGELARAFGNSAGALPFTVVIDAHGQVKYTKLGPVDAVALRHALATL